jgi:hypothetical protein
MACPSHRGDPSREAIVWAGVLSNRLIRGVKVWGRG